MLTKDDNLLFIENIIQEIKMAVFRAEIDSPYNLPNNIISTLKTDSDGNIWFFTQCNRSNAANIDKHFFAYLEYCQKGQGCRLRLSGKASIAEGDSENGTSPIKTISTAATNFVLIRFKILYAEYMDARQSAPVSIKEKVKSFFTDIFIPHSHGRYDFS